MEWIISLAILRALAPAGASAAGARESEGVWGERLGSVHALMDKAYPQARAWSGGARLYAIHGAGPANKDFRRIERWEVAFGDPEEGSRSFAVSFTDGLLTRRSARNLSGRGTNDVIDASHNGIWEQSTEFAAGCSLHTGCGGCAPVDAMFLDAPALQEILAREHFDPDEHGQYKLALFKPVASTCSGSSTLPLTPIPKKLLGENLWAVYNGTEVLFFAASTGKLRGRKSPWGRARQ